jgi:hypothetical protein
MTCLTFIPSISLLGFPFLGFIGTLAIFLAILAILVAAHPDNWNSDNFLYGLLGNTGNTESNTDEDLANTSLAPRITVFHVCNPTSVVSSKPVKQSLDNSSAGESANTEIGQQKDPGLQLVLVS